MKFSHFAWAGLASVSMLLSGCDQSSDGSDNSGGSDSGTTNYTINDPNWNPGVDEMVSISIPRNDNQDSIFALVRNKNTNAQRLLFGQSGDEFFTSVALTTTTQFNSILSFRVTQADNNGNPVTRYAIFGCSSDKDTSEIFLAHEPNEPRVVTSPICNAVEANTENGTDGSSITAHFAGKTESSNTRGDIEFDVDLFGTSVNDSTNPIISPLAYKVGVAGGAAMQQVTAYSDQSESKPIYARQSDTKNYIDKDDDSPYIYASTINPYTGAAGLFDLADMVVTDNRWLYMVDNENQGLLGTDINSVYHLVKLNDAYGNRCIDALDTDGSQLWCHDATNEGRLISFTPPEVPAPPTGAS